MLKWLPVFRDAFGKDVQVTGYRIYRSTDPNLETVEHVADITEQDLNGNIETMFTEIFEGFVKYQVAAFNTIGEGERASAVSTPLNQNSRLGLK